MVFASLEFLALFLPLFLLLYYATPRAGRNFTLLVGSWLFYAWWSPKYLLLVIALTFVAWAAALAIDAAADERRKTRIMAVAIAANVAALAWYKYANVVVMSLNELATGRVSPLISWEPVVLPIALSFTVLHAISYVVDVRRGVVKAQRGAVAFAAYMAMFPHLIAGPIVRYRVIQDAIGDRRASLGEFGRGARRFMLGLAMKVLLADPLAPVVALVFRMPDPSFADAWLGCAAYTLQLYFDFAGYSAMAIGLALMIGFRFEENFNHPYLAVSIRDFWRRWHMTLSSWLRDYLYIPLGGDRRGGARTYVNVMITMAIGGMWHGGDSWNFLLWGLIHGAAISIARASGERGLRIPGWAARALTLLVVMLAWTVFRAEGFQAAVNVLSGQFGANGFALGHEVALAMRPLVWVTMIAGVACVVWPALPRFARAPAVAPSAPTEPVAPSAPTEPVAPGAAVAAMARGPIPWSAVWPLLAFAYTVIVLTGQKTIPFLYFQF